MKYIFFILFVSLISLTNGTVNYCGSKMCSHTDEHTFCRYPAGPSPSCKGYMDARLSSQEKTQIMLRLNKRRNDVAMGLRLLPPAGDMLKLRWVEELAREAQRWANQCRPPSSPEEQDMCRDLYSITVGQCVASVIGEAPGLRPETMVDMWYMQSKHYTGNVTSYMASEEDGNYYDDFAQMIWSRTYMVGCGRSRFMTEWKGRLRTIERLVCNFAPRGPTINRPLWNPTEPATACPPRATRDHALPALCVYQNVVDDASDDNNALSLEDNLLLDTLNAIEGNESLDYVGSMDQIYLTKLAIMTMASFDAPMSSPHSVEKRERNLKSDNTPDMSIVLTKRPSIMKKNKYFVGRPKTYNMEDLNDWDNYEVIENKIEVTTAREKDVYAYDEYKELEDVTVPTVKAFKTYDNNLEDTKIEKVISVMNAIAVPTADALAITVGYNITTQVPQNKTGQLNESAIEDNDIDDYLTDAETASKLQEALERMERNLASSTPGKVRRELRDLNEEDTTQTESPTEIENKTEDRGPMLSMVLKYMPYLKTYEKNFLGEATTSRASTTSPSLTLFMIIIFCY